MPIQYKSLGNSGLKIAPIIVGCMSYGNKNWYPWVVEDEAVIFDVLKKCYDSGLRTFDTADVYSNGNSEIWLGKFIKKYNIPREQIVILTKLYFPVNSDPNGPRIDIATDDYAYVNAKGLSRKHIFDAVEASVKRLGTYVDVLQIHRLDETPKVEIMKALNDVVSIGHARYIGASSMKATEFAQLQFIADKYNWVKFISMQNYYSLIGREEEREMIPFCNDNELGKVGLIPWSPLAGGVLGRPVGAESTTNRGGNSPDPMTDADKAIVGRVEELSKKHGVSMAVISVSWVISKGASPIVGLTSVARVEDTLKAIDFKLTEEEIKYLEEPYVAKASPY